MGVTKILFIITFIGLVLAAIFGIIYDKTENELCGNLTALFVIICIVSVLCVVIRDNFFRPAIEVYQEKIKAVENANKELDKFLIDHPEFRGETNEL